MEYVAWILLAVFILILVGTPIVLFFQVIHAFFKYFFGDWWGRMLLLVPYDPLAHEYLQKNFRYYQNLDPKRKRVFVKRVTKFLRTKEFQGREDLYVSFEMEVLVAASAIQLTFGLPNVYLRHFETIILYPDIYYSTITERYHKGEVNTQGVIVLSWKNFQEGYLNPNDGRNLGLHEMAHALKIVDAMHSEEHNFLGKTSFYKFVSYAREEMNAIQNGYESFFRSYAASNDHEFFAIAIENFFERPTEFLNYHPQMYHTMTHMLNQNPGKAQPTVI